MPPSLHPQATRAIADKSVNVVHIGPYLLEPDELLLLDREDNEIRLTRKETEILLYLNNAPNQVVPKATLLRDIWGYSPLAETHTVETHIYRLRCKIKQFPDSESLLLSEPGGYSLATDSPCGAKPLAFAQD